MFDDLKKMKEKAKSLTDENIPVDLTVPDTKELENTLDGGLDSAKTNLKDGFDDTTDTAKRTAGKIKGTFTPPKTETKKGFLKDETHFFCSDCNGKLGPMETKKWKNALKALLGGGAAVAGVVLINPVLVFKGASSLSSLRKDDSTMMSRLKDDSKLKEDARNYLVQCEYCGEWVCSKCYLAEKIICTRCGAERGIVDDLLEKSEIRI